MKASIKNIFALAGFLVATAVSASPMYIQVGGNQTDVFNEFGYTGTLATSIYGFDTSTNQFTGNFYDTNVVSELTAAGLPFSGTAMDGANWVNLVMPGSSQNTIAKLNPLDGWFDELAGFNEAWRLTYTYHFDGYINDTGPVLTGGWFELNYVGRYDSSNNRVVLQGEVTGSQLNLGNLDIFFDVTYAEAGFLWVQNENGDFVDASTQKTSLILDTNVNPPLPTLDQLLLVADVGGNVNAIRQTTLDGSITARIEIQLPEPSTIALLGLGLLGLAGITRRRGTV